MLHFLATSNDYTANSTSLHEHRGSRDTSTNSAGLDRTGCRSHYTADRQSSYSHSNDIDARCSLIHSIRMSKFSDAPNIQLDAMRKFHVLFSDCDDRVRSWHAISSISNMAKYGCLLLRLRSYRRTVEPPPVLLHGRQEHRDCDCQYTAGPRATYCEEFDL